MNGEKQEERRSEEKGEWGRGELDPWRGLYFLRSPGEGFPGGSVVKSLPASAGDMGSIHGPGRSHMQWSN